MELFVEITNSLCSTGVLFLSHYFGMQVNNIDPYSMRHVTCYLRAADRTNLLPTADSTFAQLTCNHW